MNEENELITLDSFVRSVNDQKLKALLLKLKNDIRKEDTYWDDVKQSLKKISTYDTKTLQKVIPLLLEERILLL